MESEGFIIDEWQYIFDPLKPISQRLQLIPPGNKAVPEFLYKYYDLTSFSIDAVQNQYIYASAKTQLNDEFDCNGQLLDLGNVSDKKVIEFFSQFPHHTEKEVADKIDFFRNQFPIVKELHYVRGFGVISLTENLFSQTMWAHYGSSNHGFVVKFNLNYFHERMLGPFPIHYKKDWFPLKLEDQGELLSFLYMTTIKSYHWEYENEWRYIGVREDMSFPRYVEDEELVNRRKFNYSVDAIEEIILGTRFIWDINTKDEINGVMKLEPHYDKNGVKEKMQLLEFIVKHNIPTSTIILKDRSKTFELDKEPITVEKLESGQIQITIQKKQL